LNDPSRIDAIATRWSLIREAHAAGVPENAAVARQMLVLRYAKSIRRYIGGMLKNAEDADELAQDAVVRLMKGDFAGADPNRGRFRDLLKTAVRNMVHSHWSKSNRRKPKDVELDLVASSEDADPQWDSAYQSNVLEHAWAALREFEKKNPASHANAILKLRTEFPDANSEELAAKLGEKTGTAIRADSGRQMLRRARLRFAEALIQEVSCGLVEPTPQKIAEEFASLGLLEYVKDFMPEDWNATGKLC
jgi:RNA polymerase sigma factor (sigma-70 family)